MTKAQEIDVTYNEKLGKAKFVLKKANLEWVFITGDGIEKADDDDTRVYRLTAAYPEEQAKPYMEVLKKLWALSGMKGKPDHPGYKTELDEDDEPTGRILFRPWTGVINAKTGNRVVVPVYDSKNRKVPNIDTLRIGNGSIGNVAVVAKTFQRKTSKGISLYLQAIQLLKYVPYEPDFGFDEDEGEFEAPDAGFEAEYGDNIDDVI